jgi:vacuolar protein sorting-associated protein 13A/C
VLVRADAVLEGPCIFIRLESQKGSWPFLLRNDSDFPITFSQAVSPLHLIRSDDSD